MCTIIFFCTQVTILRAQVIYLEQDKVFVLCAQALYVVHILVFSGAQDEFICTQDDNLFAHDNKKKEGKNISFQDLIDSGDMQMSSV